VAHIGKGQKVARLCRTSVQHPLGVKKDDGDTKAQYNMNSMADDMYMIDRGQASTRLAQSGLRRVAGSCPSGDDTNWGLCTSGLLFVGVFSSHCSFSPSACLGEVCIAEDSCQSLSRVWGQCRVFWGCRSQLIDWPKLPDVQVLWSKLHRDRRK